MGEYGTIITTPSPGDKRYEELIQANALVRNRTAGTQVFQLEVKYSGDGSLLEVTGPQETFLPYQQTYMHVDFRMPGWPIDYYISLWRWDTYYGTYTVETIRGPIHIDLITPFPSLPGPPAGPFILPDSVRNALSNVPLVGTGLVTLAEWLLGSLNANWGWLSDLFTRYAEAQATLRWLDQTWRDWLQERDPWFGLQYGKWVESTLDFTQRLIEARAAQTEADLKDFFGEGIGPLTKFKNALSGFTDDIAAFFGDAWGWLMDHTPLSDLWYMAEAAYNVLIRLPANWSNFFWLPVDWFLEVLDLWLYEEVEE